MKVKQLEWVDDGYGDLDAEAIDGKYTIEAGSDKTPYPYYLCYNKEDYGFGGWERGVHDIDEAKSLAQEDYEKRVLKHLEDCHPSPQELFESMAPIVRYGYNRACVELCEWINVDESMFTFDELMDKLNDMIANKREMTSDDFLEYLKSEEE